ncbi:unnamed protein product [Prorocentrum cordatum]|uniref:Uncharacterized protein n=1 Tax=Prorocentrum cordatum TaxID=2364126 RepID=A0ABN9T2Q4_9DINO|nr:unnamed protein product [Polarella glacialis]
MLSACQAVQVSRGTLDQPDDRPFGERAVAIRFEVRDLSIIPGHTTQDPSLDGAGAEFEGLDFSLGLLDVSNSVVFSAEDPTSPTERFHINAVHCGSIATAEFFSDHT